MKLDGAPLMWVPRSYICCCSVLLILQGDLWPLKIPLFYVTFQGILVISICIVKQGKFISLKGANFAILCVSFAHKWFLLSGDSILWFVLLNALLLISDWNKVSVCQLSDIPILCGENILIFPNEFDQWICNYSPEDCILIYMNSVQYLTTSAVCTHILYLKK